MRRLGLLAAVAVLAGCGGGGGGSLVVYSGQHQELTRALVAAFEKETGIKVSVRSGESLVIATQILQEGKGSPADVFLSENSPELVTLQERGLLAKLDDTVIEAVPRAFSSPGGEWVGMALRVGALVYNPKLVPRSELPRSILDLTEYRWQGKLALAPTDSDFPPIVAAVLARHGEQLTATWLAGLKQNAETYQDEEAVAVAVNRGDAAVGLINHYYWYRLQLEVGKAGMHSALHFFPSADVGSVVNVSGAGVLARGKHHDEAERFVAFLVGENGQRIVGKDYEYPARPGVAANPRLPPYATVPHAPVDLAALGNGREAAQLIREAGLA
jgi:iron(III) transport system substrate-binding protein